MSTSSSLPLVTIHRTLLILLGAGALVVVLSTYFLAQNEHVIFAVLEKDWLIAVYSFAKQAFLTDACLVFAAWCLMSASQGRRATGYDLGLMGRTTNLNWGWFFVLVVCGIICSVVFVLLGDALWNRVVPFPPSDWGLVAELHHLPLTFSIDVLSLCVLAPAGEELFFRGFLFEILAKKFPLPVAVLVSASLFAFAHLQPQGFVGYLLPGIAAALLRQYTQSIWPGVILHSVLNGLFLLVVLFLPH